MAKPKFDKDASFKSIVGISGGNGDEINKGVKELEQDKPVIGLVVIEDRKKEETRSRRVNLVIKPSVYDAARKKCAGLNISFNECVNQFLEKWGNE